MRPETMPLLTKNLAAGSVDTFPPRPDPSRLLHGRPAMVAPRAPRRAPPSDTYHRVMVMCIDVGNSSVKVAQVIDGVVGPVTRTATAADPAAAAESLPIGDPLTVASATIALVSVVPAWTEAIRDIATDLGWDLIEADVGSIPMPLRVLHPERVGSDRLLGAWTARGAVRRARDRGRYRHGDHHRRRR